MREGDGIATFHCAVCGGFAAEVVAVPRGMPAPGDPPLHDDPAVDRIVIRGFIGDVWAQIGSDRLDPLAEGLARDDASALWSIDPMWAPFFCGECRRSYCARHWSIEVRFDDGFYDDARGMCPRGHRRLLDD